MDYPVSVRRGRSSGSIGRIIINQVPPSKIFFHAALIYEILRIVFSSEKKTYFIKKNTVTPESMGCIPGMGREGGRTGGVAP